MNRFVRIFVLLAAVLSTACKEPGAATPGETCSLDDDGGAYAVHGRADGLYAYGEPVKMMHQDQGWVITLNRAGGCGGS